ncbi:MAG: IS3 family transposase [Lutispora sp.]|nr:IS3 family transposase [Lutispora sp.]
MYSLEEKKKAVDLYIQYDKQLLKTVETLGYPSRNSLRKWYYEFRDSGAFKDKYTRGQKYTEEQKEKAIRYYLDHGSNATKTIAALGYPCRPILKAWIDEKFPGKQKDCSYRKSLVEYTEEQKESAVKELLLREKTVKDIADDIGVDRVTLYNWKSQQLGKEAAAKVKPRIDLPNDKESLEMEVNRLKEQIHRLELEKDILEKTTDIIKKDPGINPKKLTNKEKTEVIDALKNKYKLKELLHFLNLPKSSYFYQKAQLAKGDKYAQLRKDITDIFNDNYKIYGYRRIYLALKNKGIVVSEKVIRKIMKQDELIVYQPKQKKYSSYMGEISPEVDNIIQRDFHSTEPNTKWLTDITEFHIPAGKVYLSPIVDCFDGIVVSWTIGTSPNADLVNTMLDNAIATLSPDDYPIIHSDRGAHYRWPGWIKRMDDAKLIRSMSRKGCSPDNSACEGFFGRLKNEMFYCNSWLDVTIDSFINLLDRYIKWCNEKRIKKSLGGLSPYEYRQKLGLIA